MPNIDTSTIEGYADMTPEQKIAALEGFQIPEAVDLSKYVTKDAFDKKAMEAANLSKQLKGKMTEEELADAERQRVQAENDQKYADLESKYNDLMKETVISKYTAKYLALGYDEALAKETAEAMQAGDMDKVFANGEKHKAALEKKIRADLMNNTPAPGGNGGGDGENGESGAGEQAKRIGKAKAEANKAADDVMKFYIK